MATIELGDYVRSYDFHDRDDCYVEGVVTDLHKFLEGCFRYEINVERRWIGNYEVKVELPWQVYPPENGTPAWYGGVTNLVKKVDRSPVLPQHKLLDVIEAMRQTPNIEPKP